MNEPVIHRKKRIEVFNDRVVVAAPAAASKPVKVKKPKPEKVKKIKTPPPPPRVRGPAPVPHPDGTREERVKKFLHTLKQDFLVFQQVVPLKILIHKDLVERYPQIAKHIICGALHVHCQDVAYLRILVAGVHRYDLDGNPVDVVTEEHDANARSRLRLQLKKLIKPK